MSVAKAKEIENTKINIEGLSGLNVVKADNAVANIAIKNPAGGFTSIHTKVANKNMRKEISVPFISSISNQRKLEGFGIFSSVNFVGRGLIMALSFSANFLNFL